MATGGGNWMWVKPLDYFAASYVISKELCSIFSFVRQHCIEFDSPIEAWWLWPGDIFFFFFFHEVFGFFQRIIIDDAAQQK